MLRLSFGRDTRLSRGLELRRTRGTWLLGKAISLTVLIEFSHSPQISSLRQRINVVAFSGFPFPGGICQCALHEKNIRSSFKNIRFYFMNISIMLLEICLF